jgi:hypothetical protein
MIYNRIATIVYLFCFFFENASAQLLTKRQPLNTIYIEALGIGGYGSVNYERLIYTQKKIHIGARLGVGTYRLRDFETKLNPDLTVPFSINGYYGQTHHIEISVGQTFTSMVGASTQDFAVERKNTLSSNFSIGYRYQKSSRGLMFRVNYNPIISSSQSFKNWYGLSLGYAF